MKRYFIALGAAAFVGSTVLASAAALDVTGGVAQTATVDAACDTTGVDFWHRWDTGDVTPVSYGPKLTDIDAACAGQNLVFVAFDKDDNELDRYITTVPTPTAPATVSKIDGGAHNWPGGPIELADIAFVNVTIIS